MDWYLIGGYEHLPDQHLLGEAIYTLSVALRHWGEPGLPEASWHVTRMERSAAILYRLRTDLAHMERLHTPPPEDPLWALLDWVPPYRLESEYPKPAALIIALAYHIDFGRIDITDEADAYWAVRVREGLSRILPSVA